ncbi:MAG: hypothetical protein RIT43_2029 [Bacteroidota bacterium]|jgi:16S rRNA (guanine527-N7)-methyltransferase
MNATDIKHYFPEISAVQFEQFQMLGGLYAHWNSQINVISRKDTENFYERHVLHSLAIAKTIDFAPESKILDIGTGGGFPGIPLSILYPQCHFTLIDSIGKKIKVVNEIKNTLQLQNVTAIHGRAEEVNGQFDFIVSRAVTAMPEFVKWTTGKISSSQNHKIPNGILYLKGGDLTEELKSFPKARLFPIKNYFPFEFFDTKLVVYLPAK